MADEDELCPMCGRLIEDSRREVCEDDECVREWAQQAKDDYEFERARERRLFGDD